jgi:hypothetical protein
MGPRVRGDDSFQRSCALLLLDRDAGRADVELDAFRLLAVLIELIAEHGDHDHQRADNEIEEVVAGHLLHFSEDGFDYLPNAADQLAHILFRWLACLLVAAEIP